MGGVNKITHKELLTFSNLTNLDWHFAKLEPNEETDSEGNIYYEYKKLKDLLLPESFVKKVYNKKARQSEDKRVYGLDKQGNYLGDKAALEEMRREAGIAMEYLEKLEEGDCQEGSFLNEWEVIYGADNYKVVEDFYSDLIDFQSKNEPGFADTEEEKEKILRDILLTREEVENEKEKIRRLKIVLTVVEVASKIIPLGIKAVVKDNVQIGLGNIYKKETVFSKINAGIVKAGKKVVYIDKAEDFITLTNPDTVKNWSLALMGLSSDFYEMGLENNIKETSGRLKLELDRATAEAYGSQGENVEESRINLIKSLTLEDTGLRVAAFKKGKQIVISYKIKEIPGKEKRNKKLLPEEYDLLKIVYCKIRFEHKGCDIVFTGFDQAAELAFLSSLLYDRNASLFLVKPVYLFDNLYFTYEDLDKEYKDTTEIIIEGALRARKELFYKVLGVIFAGEAILTAVSFIITYELIKGLFKTIFKNQTRSFYKYLLNDLEFIEEEKIVIHKGKKFTIKGYITDTYLNAKYITFNFEREKINVKLEDALLLLHDVYTSINKVNKVEQYLRRDTESGHLLYRVDSQTDYLLKKNKEGVYEIDKEIIFSTDLGYLMTRFDGKRYGDGIYSRKAQYETEHDQFYAMPEYCVDLPFSNDSGSLIVYFLNNISHLQRRFTENRSTINYIYHNILDENMKIECTEDIPEICSREETYLEQQETTMFYLNRKPNEYIFLPYIKKEDGNIGEEIRDDYVNSVFKSMILRETSLNAARIDQYNTIIKESHYNRLLQNKFNTEFTFTYSYDFGNIEAKDKFMNIMEVNPEMINKLENRTNGVVINHYQAVLDRLKEDGIEKYYQEPEQSPYFKNDYIDLNPGAKSKIEYKYNPEDNIIGGDIFIKDIKQSFNSVQQVSSIKREPATALVTASLLNFNIEQLPEDIRKRCEFLNEVYLQYDQSSVSTEEADLCVANISKSIDILPDRKNIAKANNGNGRRFFENIMKS